MLLFTLSSLGLSPFSAHRTTKMSSTIEGYPQISQVMSQNKELAIVRRFGNLNMLNILHMQAELMHLEEKYYKYSDIDERNSSRAYRSRDWWSLTQLDCNGKTEQWDILLQIREKLSEYSKGPLFHFKLSNHVLIT
jgi:hypothetical protein